MIHALYLAHPLGFDNFGAWIDHHRKMHRRHPLDVPEFGAEWLRRWEAIGRLLEAPGIVQGRLRGDLRWCAYTVPIAIQALLMKTIHSSAVQFDSSAFEQVTITLLDGTVVKEWGAK